jgi:hypothetical protein
MERWRGDGSSERHETIGTTYYYWNPFIEISKSQKERE